MRPKLTAEEYEGWCVSLVERMMDVLPPDNVCILYQTPGRYSGVGGAWLDKGFLCQLGARAAGAACVWQKVVLFDDCVGRPRAPRRGSRTPGQQMGASHSSGLADGHLAYCSRVRRRTDAGTGGGTRAGFINVLCLSKRHRVPRDYKAVDVLADRGHMSYSHAMGEAACQAAVEYCAEVSAAAGGAGGPPTIVDFFCGHGSVLGIANANGLPAIGMDISLKCCGIAAGHVSNGGNPS